VPCGAQLLVHVTHGGALGTTPEVAVLTGHGPIEPAVLQELLLNAPQLRAVFVDAAGVPVSVSDNISRPRPRDPESVRAALLALAAETPPSPQPRHPDDHRRDDHRLDDHRRDDRRPDDRRPDDRSSQDGGLSDAEVPLPAPPPVPPGAHPSGAPGTYRPSRRLRRLVDARAPMCEFPGCGVRAVACDAEHDRAWPAGATCACQLGPCCRRHHRVKQEGWTKTRGEHSAVRWTTPTGRS